MKFNITNGLHEKLLAKHPQAVTLVEHVVKHGELPVGTTIINHPDIPPVTITKKMIENDFPSLQESFWWYVI